MVMSKQKKNTKQDLLYIMSPQCGWCKKANSVVEELVSEGASITTVDVTTPEGQQRANEVKQKYNVQCGTPLFIDAESGNMKCGFAEKDVLQKWVNGEEIPQPPQPKSPPPPPPQDLETASQEDVYKWKGEYEVWVKENDHLPNLMPFDQILQRVKSAQQARKNGPQQGAPGTPGVPAPGNSNVPSSFTFNNEFYYVVINGKKEVVMADTGYIQSLQQQYFQRENTGKLTKVVGDDNFNKQPSSPPTTQPQGRHKPVPVPPAVDKKAGDKLKEVKVGRNSDRKVKNKKSKKNKKTIESF